MEKPKIKPLNEETDSFGTLSEATRTGKIVVSRDKRLQDLPHVPEVYTPWVPPGRRVLEEGGT